MTVGPSGGGRRMPPWSVSVVDLGSGNVRVRASTPGEAKVPLAAAAFVVGATLIESLGHLAWGLQHWPWLVPCVGLTPSQRHLARYVPLVVRFHRRLLCLPVGSADARPSVTMVREAIGKRIAPSPADLARYVVYRLEWGGMVLPLRENFGYALTGDRAWLRRSAATYSRLFAKHGPFAGHDWQAVGRLCWAVTGRIPPRGVHAPSTQLRHCRTYLGVSDQEARRNLVAWEHVLDCALRRARYVDPDGSPASSR